MRIPHKAHAVSSRLDPVGRKVQRRRLGIPKAVGAGCRRSLSECKDSAPGGPKSRKAGQVWRRVLEGGLSVPWGGASK